MQAFLTGLGLITLGVICIGAFVVAYVFVLDYYDKVKNYRKAKDLEIVVEELRARFIAEQQKNAELTKELAAVKPYR